MNPNFKPKRAQILVPGSGVVSREDFTQDHAKALLKRAEKHGVNKTEFIKQHFVVDSYDDMPLFDTEKEPEEPQEPVKRTRKKKETAE
jgi:hypothetical protein